MADQSDVENAFVTLLSSTLYPGGTQSGSVTGTDCRIYRGWPNAAALDSDLQSGVVNVTVFPTPGSGRCTTRYLPLWQASQSAPSLAVSVSGTSATFSGTAAPGQLAGLRVDNQTYSYLTTTNDSPQSVAANLAAQARANAIVLLSAATVAVPGAFLLNARVVAGAQVITQVRRQSHGMRVICWCPSPASRDATAIAIDQAFAQLSFLPLPDGTQAHTVYSGTVVFDQSQDALLYRRDLLYSVEYPTIASEMQPAMLWGDLGVGAAQLPV